MRRRGGMSAAVMGRIVASAGIAGTGGRVKAWIGEVVVVSREGAGGAAYLGVLAWKKERMDCCAGGGGFAVGRDILGGWEKVVKLAGGGERRRRDDV